MPGPFDDLIPGSRQSGLPPMRQALPPQSPLPTPQTREQGANTVANTQRTQQETAITAATAPYAAPKARAEMEQAQANAAMAKRAAQLGLTTEQLGDAIKSVKLLPAMERDLQNVANIYAKDFKGVGFGSLWEYLPTEAAARLDHASGRMRASIAGTLGLTSKQFDTPAEQQQFINSFLPSHMNYDSDVEDKIRSLSELVNDARKNREKLFGIKYEPFNNPLQGPSKAPASPSSDVDAILRKHGVIK